MAPGPRLAISPRYIKTGIASESDVWGDNIIRSSIVTRLCGKSAVEVQRHAGVFVGGIYRRGSRWRCVVRACARQSAKLWSEG